MRYFDCAVIGTGPAGQKAAIQAAKLGKKVCIIEKENVLGGAAINTGTIPSKALREAVLHLTGLGKSGLFGELSRVKRNITIADLIYVSQQVIHHELALIRNQLDRNGVELIWGAARFHDENVLYVDHGETFEMISAEVIVIATGTRPARPSSVPFDDRTVFTSDGLLKLDHLPKTMIVVGGGVVGTEYACMLAALGVKVTLVEGRREVLGFLDSEIAEAFQYHMRKMGITLRLGEKVAKIEKLSAAQATRMAPAAATVTAATAAEDMSTPGGGAAVVLTASMNSEPKARGNGHHHIQPHDGNGNGNELNPNAPLVQATLESGKLLRARRSFMPWVVRERQAF